MIILRVLIKLVLLLVFLTLVLVGYLVATPRGTVLALEWVQRLSQGQLTFTDISGRIIHNLHIGQFIYQDADRKLDIQHAQINWQPSALLRGSITLSHLTIEQLQLIEDGSSIITLTDLQGSAVITRKHTRFTVTTQTDIYQPVRHTLTAEGTLDDFRFTYALQGKDIVLRLVGEGTTKGINMHSEQFSLFSAQGQLAAALQFTGNTERPIAIPQLNAWVEAHDAQLTLQGVLTDRWNINSTIQIADLSKFSPDLTGTITGRLTIQGPWQQAELVSDLSATDLSYQTTTIKSLTAYALLNENQQKKSQFTLKLTDANYAGFLLPTTDLNLSGNLLAHTLQLHSTIEQQVSQLTINGGWQHSNWQGTLATLSFSTPRIGPWALEKPTAMVVNAIEQKIAPFCLSLAGQKKACFSITLNPQFKITAHINQLDVAKLREIIPVDSEYISQAEGQLNASLLYTEQNLTVNAQWKNGKVFLPEPNITLSHINADMHNEGNTLILRAQAHSGNPFTLTGTLDTNTLKTRLTLNGTNILTMDTPEFMLVTSPHLTATIEQQRINVDGIIHIPKATLKPYDFSETVTLDSDVVIVQNKSKEHSAQGPWTMNTHIKLTLGDAINVDFHGLTGTLHGSITISGTSEQASKTTGQLTISNGSYHVYGQTMAIETGELHYVGGPLDNPALNITALKALTQTPTTGGTLFSTPLTVGVKVMGTADQPKITLFSRPAGLSQTDILSYLLLGVPSHSASRDNARLLLTAANALGDNKIGINNITDKLKQGLGLSELSLETINSSTNNGTNGNNDVMQNTALTVGKYLSPRLYLSYSVGLLEPVNIFRIQYLLNKYWTIQTESSGKGNGIDLLYHIGS